MMGNSKIVLVTGGARSGKSDFAERYAAVLPGRHAYVATATVSDEEMGPGASPLHQKAPTGIVGDLGKCPITCPPSSATFARPPMSSSSTA